MATSATKKHSLGIDIGSVSYGYVLMDQKEQIIQSDYRIHNGNILDLLKEQLAKIDLFRVQQIAYNHKAADFFNQGISVSEQVAVMCV
jgi:activator of 2-hydroxyglutaryl-CoA dehydratase